MMALAGRAYFTGPAFASADPFSMSLSTVALSDGAILEGETITLTLTLRRASGVLVIEPSVAVVFTLGSGTSDGVISETTDHGTGTYTATFFALTAGTARTIGATVNGSAVTSALPTVTVADPVPQYPLSGLQFAGDVFPYADTAALLANCTTGNNPAKLYEGCVDLQNLTLDETVLFDGHPTARLTYDGSAFTNQPQLLIQFSSRGKSPLSNVWYRQTSRFMAGFSDEGIGTPGAASNKYNAGGWSAYNSSLRYQDPNLPILMTATSGGTSVIPSVLVNTGNASTSLYLGTDWWDVILHFGYTAPGVPRFRAWRMVTGTAPVLVGSVTGAVTGGWPDPLVAIWYIQLNFNRSRAGLAPQYYNIGRLELVDGTLGGAHADPFGVGG